MHSVNDSGFYCLHTVYLRDARGTCSGVASGLCFSLLTSLWIGFLGSIIGFWPDSFFWICFCCCHNNLLAENKHFIIVTDVGL